MRVGQMSKIGQKQSRAAGFRTSAFTLIADIENAERLL
jgi:hypothetical protein